MSRNTQSEAATYPDRQRDYDLIVTGSGPAGEKAAIQAAKLGKRVAIIDRPTFLGGMCIHHGAIPSKTLRDAVLFFTGFYHRQAVRCPAPERPDHAGLYGPVRSGHREQNPRCHRTSRKERNRVDLIEGKASFVDEHTVKISEAEQYMTADHIAIATGTVPVRPVSVPFEDRVVAMWMEQQGRWTH